MWLYMADLAHLVRFIRCFLQAKNALCDQKNAPHAITTTLLLSNSSKNSSKNAVVAIAYNYCSKVRDCDYNEMYSTHTGKSTLGAPLG